MFTASKYAGVTIAGLGILSLAFVLPPSMASAAALQTAAPPPEAAQPAAAVPAFNDSLRPALDQVGSALNQVQIDRWKLSRELKEELRGDANSIVQDLSSQLPALFQAAQQSPAQLGPQLGVMHNVDALYDVLVRITTAAGIAGGKADAATLDNAVQGLESARKTAAAQLLQAASQQDMQLARLHAAMARATETPAANHPKTIVVNNRVGPPTRHHKAPTHHKPSAATPATKSGAGTSPANPNQP